MTSYAMLYEILITTSGTYFFLGSSKFYSRTKWQVFVILSVADRRSRRIFEESFQTRPALRPLRLAQGDILRETYFATSSASLCLSGSKLVLHFLLTWCIFIMRRYPAIRQLNLGTPHTGFFDLFAFIYICSVLALL